MSNTIKLLAQSLAILEWLDYPMTDEEESRLGNIDDLILKIKSALLNNNIDGVNMTDNYEQKHYAVSVVNGCDTLSAEKMKGSDWCELSMVTSGSHNGSITIRSKEQAEHLHFMIGKMLEISE